MIAEARRGIVAGDAGIFIRPKRFCREWVYLLKRTVPTEFRFWDEERLEWFVSAKMELALARTLKDSFGQDLTELLKEKRKESQAQPLAGLLPQELNDSLCEYSARNECSVLQAIERACKAMLRREGVV